MWQAPQLPMSFMTYAQYLPSQATAGGSQLMPPPSSAVPPSGGGTQIAAWHEYPPGHALKQPPQLPGSEKLVQYPGPAAG